MAARAAGTTTTRQTPPVKNRWELWFAARLGPWRTTRKTVAGIRMKAKTRRMEFPPGPNGSRGNPFGHAAWVKEWRAAAKSAAWMHLMPSLERARISAIVYRRAIGTADEDNDRSRCKPLVDGLRDAGVIKGDTRKFVTYGLCTEQRAGADGPGILLIVEMETVDG